MNVYKKHRLTSAALVVAAGVASVAGLAHAQEGSEAGAPLKVQPIVSAPSINVNPFASSAVEGLRKPHTTASPARQLLAEPGPISSAGEDVPWVLREEQHPWPLNYAEPSPLPGLVLNLPEVSSARVMLPGPAADYATQASFAINKYMTDALGQAIQLRSRQLEQVNAWVTKVTELEKTLGPDPWQKYQFFKEALPFAQEYKNRVAAQSEPLLREMAFEMNRLVAQITPVMNAMETHELQMAWYNAMVQIRDGMSMYQGKVVFADNAVLKVLDQYLESHPPVARPAGAAPSKDYANGAAASVAPSAPTVTPVEAPHKPAPSVAVAEKDDSSGFVGLAILLAMGGAVVMFFLRLRNRLSRKPGVELPKT